MPLSDSLHLFLDESGALQANPKKDDPLLVGGVLVFGEYDSESNARLLQALERRTLEAGGAFPHDLHFGQSNLPPQRMEPLFRALASEITTWAGEARTVVGVQVVHAGDMFAAEEGILSERRFDNRYLSMLWSLVEHLLFVDPRVAERLSPQATFHLHIASRAYYFDPDIVRVEEVEALGWKVVSPRASRGRQLVAVNVLLERDLVTMLRMALRQRWNRSPIRFGSVNVVRLNYEDAASPAALYLADLHLGQSRLLELSRHRRFQPPVKGPLLPTLCRLEYGPWLELLAKMEAAARQGQIDPYLKLADEFEASRPQREVAVLDPLVRRQRQILAGPLQASPHRLRELLEEAARIVDEPGNAKRGLAKASFAKSLLVDARIDDLRCALLDLQTRLAYANHLGDVASAEATWCEYQPLESRLPALGAEGLRLMCEMRNRWSVSLTDQFRHDEAETVLSELVSERETWLEDLARRFQVEVGTLSNPELGACLGTLGQVYAFRGAEGDDARAESCFRRAMALFDDAADRQRPWVYLGHLACDRGEPGRDLWQEVLAKTASSESASGSQFLLALHLKGFLVFGPAENTAAFLENWESSGRLDRFTAEEREHHPFGLIHQSLGMLHAKAWRATGEPRYAEHAAQQFEAAHKHMARGGALLKLLAHVALLRKFVFLHEVRELGHMARVSLERTLLAFRGHVAEYFGAAAWSEDEQGRLGGAIGRHDLGPGHPYVDRARRLLQALRFNYY